MQHVWMQMQLGPWAALPVLAKVHLLPEEQRLLHADLDQQLREGRRWMQRQGQVQRRPAGLGC